MEVAVKPSVGRIVHYVSYGTKNGEYSPECRAGFITEVGQWVKVAGKVLDDGSFPEGMEDSPLSFWFTQEGMDVPAPGTRVTFEEFHPEACSLSVHNPTGVFFNSGGVPIEHDEDTKKPGSWHWPERVDG